MKKMSVFALLVFLAAFFQGASFIQKSAQEEAVKKEEVCGCPKLGTAPDFTLKDANGNEVKLSDFKGRGIILYFWALWCPTCVGHIEEFNKLYHEFKEKNIEFFAINMGDSARRVKQFVKKVSLDFPVLLDTNEKVSQSYTVSGPPTFMIIHKAGNITFQNHFWPHNYEEYLTCE